MLDDATPEISTATVFTCPQCGEEVDVLPTDASPDESPFMICPHCKSEFVITHSDTPEEDERARREEEEKLRRRDEELNSLRIRSVTLARRAAIRNRSYLLIGALVCAVAIGQFILLVVQHVRAHGWDMRPIGYLLLIIPAIVGVRFFLRKARVVGEESTRSALTNPNTPPDFSPLRDGSQQWKNLEDVR